jgi:hypothetical protein
MMKTVVELERLLIELETLYRERQGPTRDQLHEIIARIKHVLDFTLPSELV